MQVTPPYTHDWKIWVHVDPGAGCVAGHPELLGRVGLPIPQSERKKLGELPAKAARTYAVVGSLLVVTPLIGEGAKVTPLGNAGGAGEVVPEPVYTSASITVVDPQAPLQTST